MNQPIDEDSFYDDIPGQVRDQGIRLSNSHWSFQLCYALLALVLLTIVFVISLPFAIIIAVMFAFFRQIWIAVEAGKHTHDRHMALTYLNDTTEEITAKAWKQLVDPVYYGGVPDEVFLHNKFWIALAGVPVPQKAILKARAQCNRRGLELSKEYTLDELMKQRKKMKKSKISEIDFEYLNYIVEYVDTGSRSTFALQVVANYSTDVVKIGPKELLSTINTVAASVGAAATTRQLAGISSDRRNKAAGTQPDRESSRAGHSQRESFEQMMERFRKTMREGHHSTAVDIRF